MQSPRTFVLARFEGLLSHVAAPQSFLGVWSIKLACWRYLRQFVFVHPCDTHPACEILVRSIHLNQATCIQHARSPPITWATYGQSVVPSSFPWPNQWTTGRGKTQKRSSFCWLLWLLLLWLSAALIWRAQAAAAWPSEWAQTRHQRTSWKPASQTPQVCPITSETYL